MDLLKKIFSFGESKLLITESNRKALTINMFGIFSVVLLIFYAYRSFLTDLESLALLYVILSFFVILIILYLNFTKKIEIASHLMVIALFSLEIFFLIRNGFVDLGDIGYYIFPGIYWYYIFPLYSFFLVGFRKGIIYNSALLGITILFFILDIEYNVNYTNEFRIRFLSVYMAILGLTLIFEIIRKKTFEAFGDSEKKNLELIDEIKSQNHEILKMVVELSGKNKQIEEKNAQLENLHIQKDKFFSILAHDLKNPFNSIIGISELLVSDYHEIDDERKIQLIKAINEASDKTYALLINLLEWASFQRNAIEYKPQKVDLYELAVFVISSIDSQAFKKNISLKSEIPRGITIFADIQMLQTILRNLLSNAVKFTNTGGTVSLTFKPGDRFVEISVIDSGIGISEKKIGHLFMIDDKHSESGTGGETGTGLGLMLCREFVEKHGGQIRVESEVGKGSKFTFSMPVFEN